MAAWHFLVHWTGSDYGAPYGRLIPYDFLSGFFGGSVFLTAAWALVRRSNCEVHRCWRLGRHLTAAGHRVCRRHHPDGHLTAAGVREAHHLYLGGKPGRG